MAGRPPRVTCKVCGEHVYDCGPLSARGKCDNCGVGKSKQNAIELNAHSGKAFHHWRARSIQAMGGIVPDELKPYLERD